MLIDISNPDLRLPLALVLAVVIPFGVIFAIILRIAIRARRSKVLTGTSGIIGLIGRAHTAIAPQGTIFVRGELWRARSQMSIAEGERVPPAEDEYYDFELEGCSVQLANGENVGRVQRILKTGGAEILVIAAPNGAELLVPLAESIVIEIDIAGKRIVIDPPEGLLELS